MQNKFILPVILIVLFALALGGGYTWQKFTHGYGAKQNNENFVLPSVPQKQVDDFARHFSKFYTASEPMFLPDAPFLDINGKKVTIADFEGKPTLVNLWARWCTPCVVELPSLDKFQKRYDGRINVIAIALEQGKDPLEIAKFLKSHNIGDFAGYLDKDGHFGGALGVRGLPTSFLLGNNGQILYRFEGDAEWDLADSTEFFDVFLLQNNK